jgi:hypothetical protein
MGSADQPGLDRGKIGPAVAVKIGDREVCGCRSVAKDRLGAGEDSSIRIHRVKNHPVK